MSLTRNFHPIKYRCELIDFLDQSNGLRLTGGNPLKSRFLRKLREMAENGSRTISFVNHKDRLVNDVYPYIDTFNSALYFYNRPVLNHARIF